MKRSLSNQLFSKELFSKRLRGSMTVEALYVFSLVFLSLTAATRFVYREQARCVSGFLLEAAGRGEDRGQAGAQRGPPGRGPRKERYRPRLDSLLPPGEIRFSVWGDRTRGGAELRAPHFEARIERQNPRPEDALRLEAALPTDSPRR